MPYSRGVCEISTLDVQTVHTWPTGAVGHIYLGEPLSLKKAACKDTALPSTHGHNIENNSNRFIFPVSQASIFLRSPIITCL